MHTIHQNIPNVPQIYVVYLNIPEYSVDKLKFSWVVSSPLHDFLHQMENFVSKETNWTQKLSQPALWRLEFLVFNATFGRYRNLLELNHLGSPGVVVFFFWCNKFIFQTNIFEKINSLTTTILRWKHRISSDLRS